MAPADLVVSAAVAGPLRPARDARRNDAVTRATARSSRRRASFVGFARRGGEDETLIRSDRESFAVDETAGVLAVLTERGVALLDASEETMRKLFVEEEA